MTIAPFDYAEMGMTADELIQSFGMKCSLRRNNVDRVCWAVIYDYRPKDAAQLANPTDRAAIISAGLGDVPTTPPNWEQDKLVTYVQPLGTVVDEILDFAEPLKPVRPAGVVVVYECTVRR